MKIPNQLKIGGHTYKVRVIEFTNDGYGEEKHTPQEIIINKSLSQTQKEATLIHEIMGVNNAVMHGSDTLHALLEATSQQLYQVLKDNNLLK